MCIRDRLLHVSRFSGVVTHAVKSAGKIDHRPGIRDTITILLENIGAADTQQGELLGRYVSVNGKIGRHRRRIRSIQPIQAGYQESDTETHVRRIIRTGRYAPVELLFEGAVHVRPAVIIDDAGDEILFVTGDGILDVYKRQTWNGRPPNSG